MDADILSLLKYALITRENMTPDEAARKAWEMHDKAIRQEFRAPANGLCRTCGRGDDVPTPIIER